MSYPAELRRAGQVLFGENLLTAFGHVSVRDGDRLVITPPTPLGDLDPGACRELALDATELPPGIPLEAWLHLEIYRARPDVGAICRAQPEVATALGSTDQPIVPLHGQGAFCGAGVPVFPEAQLVRDRERGERLAAALGHGTALIMCGNGAVTVGPDIGRATALMWVLEMSARMNSAAAAAGTRIPLSEADQAAWRGVADELLGRIWTHLATQHAD